MFLHIATCKRALELKMSKRFSRKRGSKCTSCPFLEDYGGMWINAVMKYQQGTSWEWHCPPFRFILGRSRWSCLCSAQCVQTNVVFTSFDTFKICSSASQLFCPLFYLVHWFSSESYWFGISGLSGFKLKFT